MRFFGARPEGTATTESLYEVDRSDVVILLIAWRYGTLDPIEGISITHQEFRRAVEKKKPLFIYFAVDATKDDLEMYPADVRTPDYDAQLDAFRQEVRARHQIIDRFATPDDLAKRVAANLGRYLCEQERQHANNPPKVGFVFNVSTG